MKAHFLAIATLVMGCQPPGVGSQPPDWFGRAESGSFVVYLFLTDDFQRTIREWQVAGTPKLHPVSSVQVGKPVSSAYLLSGCEPGPKHECNVVFDFEVLDANGKVMASRGDAPLYVNRPPPPANTLALCGGTAELVHHGPAQLRVLSHVRDQNSGRSVRLEVDLEVE